MKIRNIIRAVLPSAIINYRRRLIAEKIENKLVHTLSLSQAGQDYWVYGEVFNESPGFFLDIGAHDGIQFSNTFILEKRYHWKGICIEANPITFSKLKRNRKCRCVDVCIDEREGDVAFNLNSTHGGIVAPDCDNADQNDADNLVTVPAVRLDKLLDEEGAPSVIDYLSIDIEGAEDRALLTFPFDKYRFNCITIERPSEVLREVFAENGYLLIRDIPSLDAFYIHSSFKSQYEENMDQFGLKRFIIGGRYVDFE